MFLAATLSIMTVMLLALIRAFAGPGLFDRILAVNMFGTKTVLLVAVLSVLGGQPTFIDVAVVYVLINFISIVAVLRFFEFGRREDEAEEG